MRPSGRAPDAMRPITLDPGVAKYAEGAVLVEFGDTQVLCTASVEDSVPAFLRGKGQGWITAEYGMLPRSTSTRTDREATRGRQSGRTQEIQRLIGRSLRAVIDLTRLGERQIRIDCDVLQADGGTRSSTEAVHSTWVSPNFARQDPSAYFATPGSRTIGRIASGARPEGRMLLSAVASPKVPPPNVSCFPDRREETGKIAIPARSRIETEALSD